MSGAGIIGGEKFSPREESSNEEEGDEVINPLVRQPPPHRRHTGDPSALAQWSDNESSEEDDENEENEKSRGGNSSDAEGVGRDESASEVYGRTPSTTVNKNPQQHQNGTTTITVAIPTGCEEVGYDGDHTDSFNRTRNPSASRGSVDDQALAALSLQNGFLTKPLNDIIRDARQEVKQHNLSLWEQASWRSRVYSVVEPGSFPSTIPKAHEVASYVVSLLMALLIFISCLSVMGESYPEYVIPGTPVQWAIIEIVSVAIFSADIVLRFITCPNRYVFFFDVLNLVDLVVVLPFYLSLGGLPDSVSYLRMLRIVRLARLVRVLKTTHVMGLTSVIAAVQNSLAALFLFVALAGTALLIIATCLYFAERGNYFDESSRVWYRKCLPTEPCGTAPDGSAKLPSPFQSIPDAFWFTIVTMSTVGFGDQYPTSGIGQFVAACTMLVGVLFIAFPTMVLSGHYDLSSASSRVTIVTWKYIHEQNVARRIKKLLPPRSRLMIARGWATYKELESAEGADEQDPDGDDTNETASLVQLQKVKTRLDESLSLSKNKESNSDTIAAQSMLAESTRALLTKTASNSLSRAIFGSSRATVASRLSMATAKQQLLEKERARRGMSVTGAVGRYAGETRISESLALFRVGKTVCELRPGTRFKSQLMYSPLLKLRCGSNGDPKGTVIFGTDGMPTLVQFDLLLDTPEARMIANNIAKKIDPAATASVDLSGGLQIRHHSPLATLEAKRIVDDALPVRYVMREFPVRDGIRTTASTDPNDVLSIPLYFARVPHKDSDRHMVNEGDYLRKEDVLAECLASVLGSSLLISSFVPGRVARKRVMVVSQMIQNSRFHREVEVTSSRAIHTEWASDERVAFFSQNDAQRLLEGIHRKVDLYDEGVFLLQPTVVDADIARVVLGRLRCVLLKNVLLRLKDCVYNAGVLLEDDYLYEVPLSLFEADEEDVVEEDSLGYIEVTTQPAVGSQVRVDFATDLSGIDSVTNSELKSTFRLK